MTTTSNLLVMEEESAETWTISVHGDLDIRSAPELCSHLGAHRGCRLVVDLDGVGFCDSTGLRALLGEARETEFAGGSLRIVAAPRSAVRRLLEMTGLTDMLRVHANRQAAIGSG
jgi:anti-sigma B factor antagonist